MRRLSRLRPLASAAVIAGAWWLVGEFSLVSPLFVPSLGSVVSAAANLLAGLDVYRAVGVTVYRAMAGLLISFLLAVPLGLMLGRFPRLYVYFDLPVDFFRSVPSSALFFLFIMLFGIGNASKISVVVYGCALILLVGAVYGARPTRDKQDRVNMLRTFGATRLQIFYLAVLRDALPQIAASLRVCVSLAFVLVVVTEMFLGSADGLGHLLYDNYLAYRVPEMYAVLLILGFVGFGANRLSLVAERYFVFWFPESDELGSL